MFCHGTIVSNHWVLGDAYCCRFSHQIRFGDGAFKLPIETKVIHPEYSWTVGLENDKGASHDQNFCLYKFSTDILFLSSGNVEIACLPVVAPTVGNDCWVAG